MDAAADLRTLQILAAWFSPGYPVGAYSYSHGLEQAVAAGLVGDRAGLAAWVADLLEFGAGLERRHAAGRRLARRGPGRGGGAGRGAGALGGAAPRDHGPGRRLRPHHRGGLGHRRCRRRPIRWRWGWRRARLALPLLPVATLYLQAFAANVVSAGVRLVPLGQTDGQRITAGLTPSVARVAAAAIAAPPEAIGGIAVAADLAAMLHETQHTRLYRS